MRLPIAVTALLLLVACSGKPLDSADNKTTAAAVNEAKADAALQNIVAVDGPGAVPPGAPISKPSPTTKDADALPPAFQGRWGMTEADCDVSRGDNKGLLTVEAKTLKFYESKATIVSLEKASDYAVTAGLSFEGEGQKWTSTNTLALVTAGTALLRTEQSPAKTSRYQRC